MARAAAIWDPAQYLRFAGERLRPALDLLAQVPLDAPARVVDLGCGAGNVTSILRQRFRDADVVGVDGSAAMLEKARATVPDCRFEQGDFFQWQPAEPLDLIYTNAALQWVDRHETLFPRLLSLLAPSGVLAVQMPAMHATPLRQIPYDLAQIPPWSEHLRARHPVGAGILGPAAAARRRARPVADHLHARAVRRARRDGMGLRQQSARFPRSPARSVEGAVRPGLFRGCASALSAPRRWLDVAAVSAPVHGGAGVTSLASWPDLFASEPG